MAYDVHLPARTTRAASIAVGTTLATHLAELVEGELATQLREGGVNWAPLAPATLARKEKAGLPTPEKPGYGTGRLAHAAQTMPITLRVTDEDEAIVVEAFLVPGKGSLPQRGEEDVFFADRPGSQTQFQGAIQDFLTGREPLGRRRGSQPARPVAQTSRLEAQARQLIQGFEGPEGF